MPYGMLWFPIASCASCHALSFCAARITGIMRLTWLAALDENICAARVHLLRILHTGTPALALDIW